MDEDSVGLAHHRIASIQDRLRPKGVKQSGEMLQFRPGLCEPCPGVTDQSEGQIIQAHLSLLKDMPGVGQTGACGGHVRSGLTDSDTGRRYESGGYILKSSQ